ncbi:hypothetical protein [Aliagarivorans marinus]|uniref:hypothetical protein n=1 Tax=Aliagarivorans marinus TaxID=561965 RepID=UPI0012F97284|nr:hypothetical protein [Aliagarivorans marinus]
MNDSELHELALDFEIKIIQSFSQLDFDNQHFAIHQLLQERFRALTDIEQTYIRSHLRQVDWPRDHLLALYLCLYDILEEGDYLSLAVNCLHASTRLSTFSEALWSISKRCFYTSGSPSFSSATEHLRTLFGKFSRSQQRSLVSRFKKPNYQVAPKHIALITPQLLTMRHSPTREAYNIALHLRQLFDCQVMIINTNGMSYSKEFGAGSIVSNSRKDWPVNTIHRERVSYLQFYDETVNIVNLPATPLTTAKLIDFLSILEQLQVDSVIAHGENTFFQELVFGLYPSVFCTTGSALPFARSDAYFVPGTEFNEHVQANAKRWGHAGKFVSGSMFFTPEGVSDRSHPRASFGLNKQHFVYLVVGQRLAVELDEEFVAVCHSLLELSPDNVICFAGSPDLELSQWFGEQSRCINIGFQNDLAAICQMSDVYLNPKRQGGGTSSQTALVNGLPVVTLDYGHISSVVPEQYRFKDWDDYLCFAERLGTDRAFYQAEAQSFQSHLQTALGIEPQIRAVYAELSKACQKYFDRAAAEAQAIAETTLSV